MLRGLAATTTFTNPSANVHARVVLGAALGRVVFVPDIVTFAHSIRLRTHSMTHGT